MAPDLLVDTTLRSHKLPGESKRILVAEDDYVQYLLTKELLDMTHNIVERATSIGDVFDKLLSNHQFDLLIINTNLFIGISGKEAVKQFKKISGNIPVMAIFNEAKGITDCLYDWGVDACLSLYIDTDNFLETINEVLFPTKYFKQLIS